MWCRIGVPRVAQFDNHTNFRGAIPPAYAYFGPVVATCLDLEVTPRFIPVREPWRNVTIATIDGEVIHDGPFPLQRTLR